MIIALLRSSYIFYRIAFWTVMYTLLSYKYLQEKDRPIGRLDDSDGANFSPVKEKLEHILANHANNFAAGGGQNGTGSLPRSVKPPSQQQQQDEEPNDVVIIDKSTGSIVVDKTTKKQGKFLLKPGYF